ncbi:NarK family nitrate/nitrite MFS transporter [Cytophaga hutchinsonii]|uniref:Nitrate/nitrite transporter n=1 Tax=Cytophaga hutchinsonii (strain ATCC 33406 / DSM 1761 / CIP 103989 / NBRC 15051 / NCIMB 9469 / D465) TaxID=269798 RepID=A0A6N4SQF5_CYTH3|nr:NarK family nitrate/nitrite MFS transporter [Cytophaga hutchinsonii]ABG58591.1 possible nitrate/nitrite transporter [Cytophaga hutchinsonii ATCC 33406]SFX77754.1 MFS transporter, NNP family, nitrate/nitrite transporter [Cytophaga hutchinsonii ATCC 33406]
MNTHKATTINLFSLKTPNMKAFHMTWMAFFLCFFGWFGIAPLMVMVRDELHLTKGEIGNIMIASVSITIFARILIGYLCDRVGPRIMYAALLILGAFPVMLIGLSNDYTSFLLFRLTIGVIGASFVVTQFHTSAMFAPNIIGTANAVTAGWGNLGGGVTQLVMPLIFAGFVGLGYSNSESWRLAMVVPGIALLIMGILYFLYTTDTPEGNLADLKKKDPNFTLKKKQSQVSFAEIFKDYRVWVLAFCYGACFGIEITIDNIAALYFKDKFNLSLEAAGLIAASFGMMNLFARALGGMLSDKIGNTKGLNGRVLVLGACILLEGIGILIFSNMEVLVFSVISMIGFALFVKMSNGATYAVVPFVNKNAVGSVAGIVGAGGNIGAVLMGFLFKSESLTYNDAFSIIGYCVLGIAVLAFTIRFVTSTEKKQVEFTAVESLA